MRKLTKILIPIIIILLVVISIKIIMDNPPKSKKRSSKPQSKISVEVMKINSKDFTPLVQSYGLVDSSIKTSFSSQVSGKIVYINPKFKDGAFFNKGDLLIKIEDVDYQADLKIANAKFILAQQTLLEEEAKAKQAKEEWTNLNKKEKASALVLRTPQVQSAKASIEAAKAEVEKIKLSLKRTKIIAPFNGRVITKNIDIAQVVSNGTAIADVYALDKMQIRLPIKSSDLAFFNLDKKIIVNLASTITKKSYKAVVTRTDSSIDTNSGQLHFIAELESNKNLFIGEYLKAKLEAKALKDVILVPNTSIYQGSYVYLEKEGIITQRNIEILWQDDKNAIINEGLNAGENLVTTPLGLISSGTAVKVINGEKK